ncbi:Uncharacterised protein [Vibrio cholerae]|nr:Uncharacterised protein [Vibrio cholerae]
MFASAVCTLLVISSCQRLNQTKWLPSPREKNRALIVVVMAFSTCIKSK